MWLHVRSLGVAGYRSSGEGGDVCLSRAGFREVSFRFLELECVYSMYGLNVALVCYSRTRLLFSDYFVRG